jgi:PAZ domain
MTSCLYLTVNIRFGRCRKPLRSFASIISSASRSYTEASRRVSTIIIAYHVPRQLIAYHLESKSYNIKRFAFDPIYKQYGSHSRNVKFKARDPANPGGPVKEMTVYEYFDKKYGYLIDHWYLPLVETEKHGWFPMEICVLESNQRYQFKLTPEQVSHKRTVSTYQVLT